MKPAFKITLLIFAVILGSEGARAQSVEARAESAFRQGDFALARSEYGKLFDEGWRSASLFSNVGSCELESGNVPEAIIWYRRALIIAPTDEKLVHNLSVARARIGTSPPNEPLEASRIWPRQLLGRAHTELAAIALNGLFFLLFVLLFRRGRQMLPALLFVGACNLWFLADLFFVHDGPTGEAIFALGGTKPVGNGVVLSASKLYQGNSDTFDMLGEVPAGAEVVVRRTRPGWSEIELADGRSGWLKSDALTVL